MFVPLCAPFNSWKSSITSTSCQSSVIHAHMDARNANRLLEAHASHEMGILGDAFYHKAEQCKLSETHMFTSLTTSNFFKSSCIFSEYAITFDRTESAFSILAPIDRRAYDIMSRNSSFSISVNGWLLTIIHRTTFSWKPSHVNALNRDGVHQNCPVNTIARTHIVHCII
jgi:hypothetical protein